MNEIATPTLRDIEAAVCARFGLTPEILRGPKKQRGIARPRQIVMFLAREMTPLSYPQIGAHFHRHHTTVLSGERRIRALMTERPKVAAYVKECRALVVPREKQQARALAALPLVTDNSDTNTQTVLPLEPSFEGEVVSAGEACATAKAGAAERKLKPEGVN